MKVQQAAAQQAANESAKQQRQAVLSRAGLTGLLARCTFDSFKNREDFLDASKILFRVRDYADAVIRGDASKPWLILYGDVGMGKSHLAAAVLREAIDAGIRDVYFRGWPRYLQRIKATWRGGGFDDEFGAETEAEIIQELARGRVVVIDDLDKQPATEWSISVLYNALNQRYNACLPTILTFNHDIGDRVILDYIGEAVLDRIVQHAYCVIEFKGPSYRLKAQ